ncbi:unnamed protein product [Musa acuminata subsp. burmannicoides]
MVSPPFEDETGNGTRNSGENMELASSTVHSTRSQVKARLENQIMCESGGELSTEKDKGELREDGQVKGTYNVNFVFGPWGQRNETKGKALI